MLGALLVLLLFLAGVVVGVYVGVIAERNDW